MGELHAGPKHTLCGTDPESYFDLHVVTLDINQKERATASMWHITARLNPDGWGR